MFIKQILLILLYGSSLFSSSYVAKVINLKGNVFIAEGQKLFLNSKIFKSNIIRTKKNSKIQLKFIDGAIITIGSKSEFSVDEYSLETSKEKATFSLNKGVFKFLSGKIAKLNPSKFRIKTKNATIGVRGTYVGISNINNLLGVLYLGKGNGAYVFNENGQTELIEVGDGVFLDDKNLLPSKASKWSFNESNELLRDLSFLNDELDNPSLSYQNDFSYEGETRFAYFGKSVNKERYHGDLQFLLNVHSPKIYNTRVNVEWIYSTPLFEKFFKPKTYNMFTKANLEYMGENLNIKIGNQLIETPLVNVKNIVPSFDIGFSSWNKHNSVYDWWWPFLTYSQGVSTSYIWNDTKISASYIQKMKFADSDRFVKIGQWYFDNALNNSENETKIYNFGITSLLDENTKIQFHTSIASKFLNNYYFQFDTKINNILFSTQYLKQKSSSSFSKNISSDLAGIRVGYKNSGFKTFLSANYTFAKEGDIIGDIISISDGTPAFTNDFPIANNHMMHKSHLSHTDGAYKEDTKSISLFLGYDFNYLNIFGLKGYINHSIFNHKEFKNTMSTTFNLNYIVPRYDNLSFDIKYSTIKNDAFTGADNQTLLSLIRYKF